MIFSTIPILTFVAVTFCVVGVAGLLFDMVWRDRWRRDERLRQAFRDEVRNQVEQSPLFHDLQQLGDSELLPAQTLGRRLQTWIDQAGLNWTVPQMLLMSAIGPLVILAAGSFLTSRLWLVLAIMPVAGVVPWLYVNSVRARRRTQLCAQLPDAFDVMSRALRAGQTVQAAFQVVANDFPQPVAHEFAYCYEQQHLGMSRDVALRDLARRTDIMEMQIFVVAMIINKRTGGNLAELLSKLATMIRKRVKMQSRLRALTGEGRMQAIVLAVLPVLLFVALLILNPTYAQELVDRPALLAGCAVSQIIGALWIRKMMRIDY